MVCMCVCLSDRRTYTVMSQALYCGCRTDSLIRKECRPWHPEFSTGITHSACFLPRGLPLGMNTRGEGTLCLPLRLPLLLLLSLHPSLTTSLFHVLFITFSFPSISYRVSSCCLSELCLSSFPFLCWTGLQSGSGVTRAHDSQVSQTNSGLLLRKQWWIRRRGIFLGLVQDNTHTHTHTHICKHRAE